jgi:hypothetical protein
MRQIRVGWAMSGEARKRSVPIDPARKYYVRPFGLSLSKPCCNALRQAQGERKSELFADRINNIPCSAASRHLGHA